MMFHYATIVNTVAVIFGSLIGIFAGKIIPEKVKKTMFTSVGLITLGIGTAMVVKPMIDPDMSKAGRPDFLLILFSLLIGGIIGEVFDIEGLLEKIAGKVKRGERFSTGFVSASLLFTVGPMTVVGCLNIGLQNDASLILVKSLMDFISSSILASLYGLGVTFSAVWVLIFQGLLVSLAKYLEFLSLPTYLGDMTALGGLLVLAIGIRILEIKEIKVGNFLPAIVIIPIMDYISTLI
jgi:uncharacterized membrane protein YqgA involved in biofilm formation